MIRIQAYITNYTYLPQRLTHAGRTAMSATCHEATPAGTVYVVAAVVTRCRWEHETLSIKEKDSQPTIEWLVQAVR